MKAPFAKLLTALHLIALPAIAMAETEANSPTLSAETLAVLDRVNLDGNLSGNTRAAQIVADAALECEEFSDNLGTLDVAYEALIPLDLEGDGAQNDMIVDFNYIHCSHALTLWAGTGGSPVHLVLNGEKSASWLSRSWQITRMGPYMPAVMLLSRHGSYCDTYGAQPCVQAIVVSDGDFLHVTDSAPDEPVR